MSKKRKPNPRAELRHYLGITQEDVARLVGVTRSQLAAYEVGERDIPVAASLKFVQLWKFAQDREAQSKPLDTTYSEEAQKQWHDMAGDNFLKLIRVKQRLSRLEEQLARQSRLKNIKVFIDDDRAGKDTNPAPNPILSRQTKYTEKLKGGAALLQLRIRLEVLQYEKELLDKVGNERGWQFKF